MPAYSGKHQYSENGGALSQGPCQLSFDAGKCIVTPGLGAPIVFDFGDVERVAAGDLDLQLTLYTGKQLVLRQFGNLFSRMSDEVVAAWRDRTVRCMLLEDLEEVARFTGAAAVASQPAARAEIRVYRTNIAVLPVGGTPVNWRLAELESVTFDQATYSVVLQSASERMVIGKLAKKTDLFMDTVRGLVTALRNESAAALHDLFPFLPPDLLQRLITAMPEGRSVKLASLAAIHPKLPDAFLARAVDARLRPYFEALRGRSVAGSLMAGFKFIREEEAEADGAEPEQAPEEVAESGAPEPEPEPEPGEDAEEKQPLFFWFFFPLAERGNAGRHANVVAWEASTGTGRATYFFRPVPEKDAGTLSADGVEAAVARMTRALALVNFRREPVYLPDESLERQPRYHRYAIGCRKLPELRELRASMLGRAIHSSVEAWSAQVEAIAGRSRR